MHAARANAIIPHADVARGGGWVDACCTLDATDATHSALSSRGARLYKMHIRCKHTLGRTTRHTHTHTRRGHASMRIAIFGSRSASGGGVVQHEGGI